mmetsp:Transcript_25879/g.38279  ORF Transcript_25879/g.38279 Transcript_25879/m.38279 type:complete len:514 (+) Transcript_25879:71-1612(+)
MATKYGAVAIKNDADDINKSRAIEMPDNSAPKCRDPIFAILFIAHLAGMLAMGILHGSFESADSVETELDDEELESVADVLKLIALPCTAFAFIMSLITTAFIIPINTEFVVKASVLSWLCVSIGIMITAAIEIQSYWSFAATGPLVLLSIYYVYRVWYLIPFAAVNLKVALKGMSANWGIYLIATGFTFVTFMWIVGWFYVFNGFLQNHKKFSQDAGCFDADGNLNSEDVGCEMDSDDVAQYLGIMFLFLVSLYWTIKVIFNTIRVTVAGVMATWCFDAADASSCCSNAVTSSIARAIILSLGSICFGSLLEAIISALRTIAEMAKAREDADGNKCDAGSILLCILTCILNLLEDIIEYFNQWAYVYVGIYGTSYLESGKRVMDLFRNRGWTALFTTDLASHVLGATTVVVGILSGLLGMAIDSATDKIGVNGYWDSFFVGLIVGLFITHVIMNVIMGAINTVIVCFADAPEKFDDNHPALTQEMAQVWVKIFPECGADELVGKGPKYQAVV